MSQVRPKTGLFVTCLVDAMRPSVGFAAAKLLDDAGCDVIVPPQTCCGQPAFNSGDRATTRDIALMVMDAFSSCRYVVAPSGSCAGMIARHYPELFADDPALSAKARAFAAKTYELVSFLTDVMKVDHIAARFPRKVAYHDSCSGLRELGVQAQPRTLLAHVEGLELVEMREAGVCCGFGGTFAVKYGEISGEIVRKKAENIIESGAQVVLAGDLGCLMNMAGKLTRDGHEIEVRHVAEVLANMTEDPGIGEPDAKA